MDSKLHDFIVSLHKKHALHMEQYAYRLTGDYHIAQDLVQEAFMTATLKAEQLYNHQNPAGWLYKTLHYMALREMDRAHYHMESSMEEISAADSRDCFSKAEFVLPVELDEDEKEFLLLRFEKNYSFEEIAEYKGITQAACRQRVSRAVKRCRKLLGVKKEKNLSQIAVVGGIKR